MSDRVLPITSIANYVPKYCQSITVEQYRLIESIEANFIESCVIKFASKYQKHMDMFHKLIGLVEQPDDQKIILSELIKWKLDHIKTFYRPQSYADLQMCCIINHDLNQIISWVNAIYLGLYLLRSEMRLLRTEICLLNTQIRLKEVRLSETNALKALANLSEINYVSDNDSDDNLSESETIDYLII